MAVTSAIPVRREGGESLMPWARLDDEFDDHPKVIAVLEHEHGGAAIGLWTLCLTWAYRNTLKRGKTPGRIPASLPRRYLGPGARELAALLVKEGLWDALPEGEGWSIHDFAEYLATPKTRAARSEAGKRGAAARWGNRPRADVNLTDTDSNLPSDSHVPDGKAIAANSKSDGPDADSRSGAQPPGGKLTGVGNEPSSDSNLPSGLPFDDGKAIANDGSRAHARRAISNEIASRDPSPVIPPSAGRRKNRAPTGNPGDVVAAYIEGAQNAGIETPSASLKARVGRQARELLAEGKPLAKLVDSARRMGAGGWDDLARQLQRDSAAAAGTQQRVTTFQNYPESEFDKPMYPKQGELA